MVKVCSVRVIWSVGFLVGLLGLCFRFGWFGFGFGFVWLVGLVEG